MPVPFRSIPIVQLLHHEAAYQLINISGRLQYDDWNILEFEKGILGCDGRHYYCTDEEEQVLLRPLLVLDHIMPFLRFKEAGQHYGYELFLSFPKWHLRGDPFFWAYAARCFTYDKLPMDPEAFSNKYMSIVEDLGIPYGKDEWCRIERFAAGGMSSGCVHGGFVKEAHDLLLVRLQKYT